jgi:TPR repeat protein
LTVRRAAVVWLRAVAACLALSGPAVGPVWALDPDIAFQIRSRKEDMQAQCPELLALQTPLSPLQTFGKAQCLLYGLEVAEQPELALDMLRQVAPGLPQAQLILADALHAGTVAQQEEALTWYGLAAAAGDVRASARRARLLQRMETARATAAQPAAIDNDPFSDPLVDRAALPPGYHCHFYGLDKKVCHGSGFD